MRGKIGKYLSDDHRRLEEIFNNILQPDGSLNHSAYGEFRKGILRHIAIEEKILVGRLSKRGTPSGYEERLRLDHGAITALLVPDPNPTVLKTIKEILKGHNVIEEKDGGFYDWCDKTLGDEAEIILKEMKDMPPPSLLPNLPYEQVLDSLKRVLKRAGYDLVED